MRGRKTLKYHYHPCHFCRKAKPKGREKSKKPIIIIVTSVWINCMLRRKKIHKYKLGFGSGGVGLSNLGCANILCTGRFPQHPWANCTTEFIPFKFVNPVCMSTALNIIYTASCTIVTFIMFFEKL